MTRLRRIAWMVTAAALWLSSAQGISAHGGGTPRLTGETVGPYLLYVWSEPEPWRAGEVHLSLAVTVPTTNATGAAGSQVETPVTDADITVTLTPREPPGEPIEVHAVRQDLPGYPYYDADTRLPSAGSWEIAVHIAGSQGRGETSFEMSALPAQVLNWWLVGGAGGVLLILVVLMGLWSRKRQPAPKPPRRVTQRAASRTRGEGSR